MQLSLIGQKRTAALLAKHGLTCRVADFSPFSFTRVFEQRAEQIDRVEEISDAYHLTFGDESVMVAYLLEVRHASPPLFHERHGDRSAS